MEDLADRIETRGAEVSYNDPYIPKSPRQREHGLQMASRDLTEASPPPPAPRSLPPRAPAWRAASYQRSTSELNRM